MLWIEVGSRIDFVPWCCVQMLRHVEVVVGDLVGTGVVEGVGIEKLVLDL